MNTAARSTRTSKSRIQNPRAGMDYFLMDTGRPLDEASANTCRFARDGSSQWDS